MRLPVDRDDQYAAQSCGSRDRSKHCQDYNNQENASLSDDQSLSLGCYGQGRPRNAISSLAVAAPARLAPIVDAEGP
jgi:hypothetical protein